MLIKPSIDELERVSEDRYLVATVAAKRAKEILLGKKPITEEAEVNVVSQVVSQAAKELGEGLIGYTDTFADEETFANVEEM